MFRRRYRVSPDQEVGTLTRGFRAAFAGDAIAVLDIYVTVASAVERRVLATVRIALAVPLL